MKAIISYYFKSMKYRLLKDLPGIDKGSVLEITDTVVAVISGTVVPDRNMSYLSFPKEYRSNSDWFEPLIEHERPEKIDMPRGDIFDDDISYLSYLKQLTKALNYLLERDRVTKDN